MAVPSGVHEAGACQTLARNGARTRVPNSKKLCASGHISVCVSPAPVVTSTGVRAVNMASTARILVMTLLSSLEIATA